MNYNPHKYDQALQNISTKVFKSSDLYLDRISDLQSKKTRYNELIKERDDLMKEKEKLLNLEKTYETIEKKKNNSIERYQQIETRLRDSIFQEAALAIQHQESPLIFSDISSKSYTSKIEKARYQVRLIKFKSKILKNIDKLYQLKKNVFCIDDTEDEIIIRQLADEYDLVSLGSEFDFLNPHNIERANSTNDNMKVIKSELIDGKYQDEPEQLFKQSILDITEQLQNWMKQHDPQSESQFDISNLDNLVFPQISKVQSTVNHENSFNEQSDFNSLLLEIEYLADTKKQQINSILSSFPSTAQFSPHIGLLNDSREQILHAQNAIDKLNYAITTNQSIPPEIWEKERRIRGQMECLVKSIKRINEKILRIIDTRRYPSIGHIGYPKLDNNIHVNIISPSQIIQCRQLISQFEKVVADLEKENAEVDLISEALDEIAKLQAIDQESDREESIPGSSSRGMSRSNSNIFTEDEQTKQIMSDHSELLNKQNEEVTKAFDAVNGIHNSLKSINFNQSEFELSTIDLPTIQLLSIDDSDSEDCSNQSQSNMEEIIDQNERLINELGTRCRGDNSSLYLSIGQQIKQEEQLSQEVENFLSSNEHVHSLSDDDRPKFQVKILQNDKLENIFDEFQEKVKYAASGDQTESQLSISNLDDLLSRKSALEDQCRSYIAGKNELIQQRKGKENLLETLQSQILTLEEKINNKSVQMRSKSYTDKINCNQEKLETLQNDLGIKQLRHQYYSCICAKIKSIQAKIDAKNENDT